MFVAIADINSNATNFNNLLTMKRYIFTFFLCCFAIFCYAQESVEINKTIDGFKFIKVQTGWSESTRRPGTMFPDVRLLIKNVSGSEVTNIPALQNQLTYAFFEDDIVIKEGDNYIHSSSRPAWKPNVSKYVSLVITPSFRNLGDKYKNKNLTLEIYYHDKFLCKVNIAPVLADWESQ